jgi:N-formylglutamate deformylase
MDTYQLIPPSAPGVPILLSVPHCGTAFPDEIKDEYVPELIASPDDTDWYVDRLYNFAPSLGITMIIAVLSRWVIDLNRHPESRPLYTDGRIITDLCPATTFFNQPLYRDSRPQVSASEIERRTKLCASTRDDESELHGRQRKTLSSAKSRKNGGTTV